MDTIAPEFPAIPANSLNADKAKRGALGLISFFLAAVRGQEDAWLNGYT